jgi:hypothetical protein
VAACAFLTLVLIGLAWKIWCSNRISRLLAADAATTAAAPGLDDAVPGAGNPPAWNQVAGSVLSNPRVLLSIEPVGSTADSDTETPVVFPGYLLPDDNHEEPAHEGS